MCYCFLLSNRLYGAGRSEQLFRAVCSKLVNQLSSVIR